MEDAPQPTDVYLTHAWQTSPITNRRHHSCARTINEQLIRSGLVTWFDHVENGATRREIDEGMENTKCVVVFVDETYMKNVDVNDANDNCWYEFTNALEKAKKILYLIMEEKFQDRVNWFGKMKEHVGFSMLVPLAGDLEDRAYLNERTGELVARLGVMGIPPSQTKNQCPQCVVVNRNKVKVPWYAEGQYCTWCGSDMIRTMEPKNFCWKCNKHHTSVYCGYCKQERFG